MGLFLDKYKIKEEEEEEPFSFLNKYKTQVGLGIGAKATGGISLPETAEIKPLIEGLPISKPEDKPAGLFEDPKMIESHKANFEYWKLWLKELKESKDKIAFLKGEGKSSELIEVQKKSDELIPYMYGEKGGKWLNAIAFSLYSVGLGYQLADALVSSGFKVKGVKFNAKQIEDLVKRAYNASDPETGKITSALSDNDYYALKQINQFLKTTGRSPAAREMLEKIVEQTGGLTFQQQVNIFGTKLYAGLPADEIAKSIVAVGKVTAEMVKGLDPVKVSQVTQALLNTSPALASAFLKAVEKPEGVKEVVEGKEPESIFKQELREIPIEQIESVSPTFMEKVKEYREQLEVTTPPPIEIIEPEYEGGKYRIVEGQHRIEALKQAGEKTIKSWVTLVDKEGFPLFKAKPTPAIPAEFEGLAEEARKYGISKEDIIAEKDELIKIDIENRKSGFVKGTPVSEEVVLKRAINGLIEDKKSEIKITKITDILTKERQNEVKKSTSFEDTFSKSKVPEVVYHGSQSEKIIEFEKKKSSGIGIGAVAKAEGEAGFWFTSNKGEAKAIGNVIQAKLNMKNPLILEGDIYFNTQGTARLDAISEMEGEGKDSIIFIEPTTKQKWYFVPNKEQIISKDFYTQAVTEKPAVVEAPAPEAKIELATPAQINKAYSIAKSRAMVSEEGKLKPQYRQIAEAMTGKRYIEKMTPEEAEMFIDSLNRLPEPKYRNGKLVPPSIPRTMKLTTEGFFQKKYGEPTPIWLLTDQTYYAEKLGIKPLVEPFEKGKQEFDLEFRHSSNLVDRMVNKLNQVAKTPGLEKIKSKMKNIPTKAESKMAELLNKHEATPPGLSENEEDIFKYFRNLSKDIWRRENKVREKLDLPPIKYKTAYFRHTADAMAKEILEGKYPFPQGIKYWSEKMVGKKIFNPMEFHRKLSDDLIDLWSKDIRAVTKAMLWNGLKEIYLAEPAKFLNEQLNAISKDLPEYKNLTPREQAAYEQTQVMPASTKKWLIDYVNQVIKGQETELDASLNRIVTKSGLKGIFDKALSPFGRSVGRTPITHLFSLSGRMIISGTMGWVPRQIIRNAFQQVQNLALYGVQATIKSFLPASIDKNLKGLLSESLFMKSYTGFEELPADLMGKLEKVWLGPYGIVAVNNAKQGMKAAYWNILELIKNPKFKKYGWADPQRTKDTPKGFLYPSEEEKLLKEMEFGSSCTQYQYIPMGMPGVFRYKALIPLTRLQSWWMNYFTKFNREAIHRGLKGRPSWSGEDGPTLPWSRRVNWLKYVVIGGAVLTALGYKKSFMLGVAPTYLSPAGQVALGLYNYATATEDWQKKRALNQIYYSWKAFIPGSLAWRDFLAVWNGEKDLEEILFYGKKEKEKIVKPTSPYLDKYKKETTVTPTSPYLNKYKK